MFDKNLIAIDINEEKISILIGNKFKIFDGITIEMQKDIYKDDEILDVEKLSELISPAIKKYRGKVKEVAFCIRGQDLITRHLVLPYMKDEAMRDSVEFELKQFVGDRIDNYYFDYEIINYDKNQSNGNADVLIVAAEKNKIQSYIELAKLLKLTITVIDIYANTIARVFKNLKTSFTKRTKSVGIISIDGYSNSMIITEWGKLTIEKYQDYGLYKASEDRIESLKEYTAFINSINLIETRKDQRKYDRFFQALVNQYSSLIQFYSSGKVKKTLDRIYVIGSGTNIKSINKYIEFKFNTTVSELPNFNDLKFNARAPKKIILEEFLYPYGLLLRRE